MLACYNEKKKKHEKGRRCRSTFCRHTFPRTFSDRNAKYPPPLSRKNRFIARKRAGIACTLSRMLVKSEQRQPGSVPRCGQNLDIGQQVGLIYIAQPVERLVEKIEIEVCRKKRRTRFNKKFNDISNKFVYRRDRIFYSQV